MLNCELAGAYLQVSRSSRTCSTPLLLAPSISRTSSERPSAISMQRESWSSKLTFGPPVPFRHLAKMRAMVVLPVPRGQDDHRPRSDEHTSEIQSPCHI